MASVDQAAAGSSAGDTPPRRGWFRLLSPSPAGLVLLLALAGFVVVGLGDG
jgi:hypothetical protein